LNHGVEHVHFVSWPKNIGLVAKRINFSSERSGFEMPLLWLNFILGALKAWAHLRIRAAGIPEPV
jgi:hypothetical protein